MRDQVTWAFYIGNFTFLVGVAAAAVLLVIPAYVYDWKPIKEVVVFGELLAMSAIVMCLLFVMVDIGRPDRFWHLIPPLGHLNFPRSTAGLGRAGPEHLPGPELRGGDPHPVPGFTGRALQQDASWCRWCCSPSPWPSASTP